MSKERNGHANPEELRKLAADWRAQAERLESLGGTMMSAYNGIEWFGFAYLSASIAANAVNVKLRKMAEAAREFADFLDEYAAKVEEQIKRERAAGIIQAVLAILGLLTIGLAFVLAPALAALSSLLASLLPAMSAVAGRIATMVIDFALGFLTFGSMQVALEFGTRGVVFGAMGLPMEVGSSEILLGVLLAGGLGGLFSIRGLFSSVNSVPLLGPRGAPPVPKMQAPKITRPESANGRLASSAPVKGPDIASTPRVSDATPAVSASDITAAPVVPTAGHTAPTVSASSAGDASRLAAGAPGGSKAVNANASTQQATGHLNQPLAAPPPTTTTAAPQGGTRADGLRMANLDRTDPHVGARGDFSPQANAPAGNVVRQPAQPQTTERGLTATAQGRGVSPESPVTGPTIHATPPAGPATVPHGTSLPPAMRPGGLPEPSVLNSGNHLIPPAGRPGVADHVPATNTSHAVAPVGPRGPERVLDETAISSAPLAQKQGAQPFDKILEKAPRITADGTVVPPRTADIAAPQHPATPTTPTTPRNPERVPDETATGTSPLNSELKNERLDKLVERAPRITADGTVVPPRTADIAAPQHPATPTTPTTPRNPERVPDETATGTSPLNSELKNERLNKILEKAPRITADGTVAPPRTADIAGPTPRPEVDTAVAGHSDRSAATGVDSRLLDASAPPAPAPAPTRADAGGAQIEHGAVPLRPDPAATRADAPVPTATPRASTPVPGRQLLQTGPDGRIDFVRVSAEPVFPGVGRRFGDDAHLVPGPSRPGPGQPLADPVPQRSATGPDTSFSYTELRADGTMGPTTLRPGENVLHSQPLNGKPQEQILSYSAHGKSWDVNSVAPATRPDRVTPPTQMLRQNPDGTVDLLTFQKPPALTPAPPVKPRPGETAFHDLDGPRVRHGWQPRSIDPGERFTAEQVSKPQSIGGQRVDGKEQFFQREPTSVLFKDQASHQWTPLGTTEGVVGRPKGWGRDPDAPPVTVGNSSLSREGTGQGNTHYRWNETKGAVEPVEVPATSLQVAEIGTQTRSVVIDRWTATSSGSGGGGRGGGGGGGGGIDSLRMLPDGTLIPANPRAITADQIRFDPRSGAITMDGAQPTGGHSFGGGGGAPGPRGGGLSSRGPSHGSATQTDDGALTFVKPTRTAESSAAAMARDARAHAGASGERPDPGRTLGSDKPATDPGAGIGGPAEAKTARTITTTTDGQVVLGTPAEAPRNVLHKPQPEQTTSAEMARRARTITTTTDGQVVLGAPADAPRNVLRKPQPEQTTGTEVPTATPAHDATPGRPTDAVAKPETVAQPETPPVTVNPTSTPVPTPTSTPVPVPVPVVSMRAPLPHEAPYVIAMPEGLSMTVQGNVMHLHTGPAPTRLALRPGPNLTVIVDNSVTNLPTIRAALTELHPSQPPVSTVEFADTRERAITPQRAQQIADRLLTGLPGTPEISLLASTLTDTPPGAAAATSYRFGTSTNPTAPRDVDVDVAAPQHTAGPVAPHGPGRVLDETAASATHPTPQQLRDLYVTFFDPPRNTTASPAHHQNLAGPTPRPGEVDTAVAGRSDRSAATGVDSRLLDASAPPARADAGGTRADAVAQPEAPPVTVDPTPAPPPAPAPALAVSMRAPLPHETPYVIAMPEGLSMTVQGNVMHLHAGPAPTRLVLRPGPNLTVIVDNSVTNLPTIRAALTELHPSQPPVSTVEFADTRERAITPQRAQQIADRLLTGLPGTPQISLRASTLTDTPPGAPTATSYRFGASTNPTPDHNLPVTPAHDATPDTPTDALAQPAPAQAVQWPMRAPLAHEAPYVTAMPEGLSMTVQGNVVHLHAGPAPTWMVLRPGPNLTVVVHMPTSPPAIRAALTALHPSQPPIAVEFVDTAEQAIPPRRAQRIADRLLTGLPGTPQISLRASTLTDTPPGAPTATPYRLGASTNPAPDHNLPATPGHDATPDTQTNAVAQPEAPPVMVDPTPTSTPQPVPAPTVPMRMPLAHEAPYVTAMPEGLSMTVQGNVMHLHTGPAPTRLALRPGPNLTVIVDNSVTNLPTIRAALTELHPSQPPVSTVEFADTRERAITPQRAQQIADRLLTGLPGTPEISLLASTLTDTPPGAAAATSYRFGTSTNPNAPGNADVAADAGDIGAVPLPPEPAVTRVSVPTATPRARTPVPGRQLLQTGPDGRTDLVRVSAEPVFPGVGRRLSDGAYVVPPLQEAATDPETSFSYTELRADGTMGPTTLRPGENVLHSQPLNGKPQEQILSYSAHGRSWDVNSVASATRPDGTAPPTQMLRQNPDGTVDLLTFQKPPALTPAPPVKPRPGETAFHDLDGPGVRHGWQSRSIDPGERFTAEQVSKPQSIGQRLDGAEVFFQREPTSVLVKDQASHQWTPLGRTEGVVAPPNPWGPAPDAPPATVGKPAGNPSLSRGGTGQGTSPDNTHYRWNETEGAVEPVEVSATSLQVAEIGTQTRSVAIKRWTATGSGSGGSGDGGGDDGRTDSLRMLPDGTLIPANSRVITADQIRFDPESGAITMDGAQPTGGRSFGGGGGAPGSGGGGAPGPRGGGLSSRGPSHGSATQTDDGALTFVKPTSTAESSAAATARDARAGAPGERPDPDRTPGSDKPATGRARDARAHAGAPGERPDPGRTLGSDEPATDPGAGIGGPVEANTARTVTTTDKGQVVLGTPAEAPRTVLRKPQPEQTTGAEVPTPDPTPGGHPAATTPADPPHDPAPGTPTDAAAQPEAVPQPEAPPVMAEPTPTPPRAPTPPPVPASAPAPAVSMRAPLAHEAPYVTAMPEGLSMTVQGNVVHLHAGPAPTWLALRPGPNLTVIVGGTVTSLPTIRAALAALHPSQPPVSTVEFLGTRQPITPQRAQRIADRLLTGLPGTPQISLRASALTDPPAGAPTATSYRFGASTNPTAGHNLRLPTDAGQLIEAALAEQVLHAAGLDVDSRFHAALRQWRDAHPEQADRLDEVLPAVRATFDARTARSWQQLWETGDVGRGWATEVDRAARDLPALLDAAVARPAPVEAPAGATVDDSVAELADDIFRRTVSTLEYDRGLDVPAGHLAAMRAAFRTSMQATYDRSGGDDWDEQVAQRWTDLRAGLIAAGLAVAAAQDAARAFHGFLGDWAGRPGALDATISTHAVRLLGAQFARGHLAAHDNHVVGLEALQQQAFDDALAELRDPYTPIVTLSQAARTQQWTAWQDALRTDYAARIGTAGRVEQFRPDLVGAFADALADAAAWTGRSPQSASLDGLPAEVADRLRTEFVAAGRHLFDQVWALVIAKGTRDDDPAFQAAEHDWQVRYEQLLTAVRGTLYDAQAGYFTTEALRPHANANTPVEGDDTRPLPEATPTAYESAARPVVDQARADIHAALHRPGRDIDDATRQRITGQLDASIREATSAARTRAERGGNTPAVVAAAIDGLRGTVGDLVSSVPVLLLHHALLGEQVRAAAAAFRDLPTIDLPAPVSEALGRSFTLDWLTAYDELFRGTAGATTGLPELAETVQLGAPAQHLTDGAPRTALFDGAAALPGRPAARTERPSDPAIVRRTTRVDAQMSPTLQQWAVRRLVRGHVRPEGFVPPAPFGLRKSPDGTYALPDGWVIEDLPWYAWARPAQVRDEALATRIRAGEFAGDIRFIVGEPGVAVPTAVTTAGLDLLVRMPEVPGEPVPVRWFSDSEPTGPAPDTRTAADQAADTLAANGHPEVRDAFLAETDPVRRNGLLAGLLGEGDAVLSVLPALHTALPVVKASDAAMAWLLGYAHEAARGEPLPVAEVRAAAMRLHTETKTTLMDGLHLLAVANPERRQVLHALGALILDC
ncbi:hypothetical protein [Micromonospora zamorensis]|uniref:hypothetical protein n=1 Tax=Micromonospora zamorensis TaxID=709883 RepID=UPI00081F85A7|nr:hypothetical protein [Micromonospora zamorensis]SCG57341.1 hypothetical protein GA0070619_3609 [Micromonospora zamorensis]